MHLRKATQHMGKKTAKKTAVAVVAPPPGFKAIGATNNIVDFQQATCTLA